MSEETAIARLARKLGTTQQNAAVMRDRFNQDKEGHAIMADRIDYLIEEKRRKYDKVAPADLLHLQGFIEGATKALAALNAKE